MLIVSSEELGVPVTVHQTILPLIHCFGKGLCSDGIDVLVRIGGLLGENFVARQILPLLRNVVNSCVDASYMTKPEPMQIWSSLALMDCLMTLDGLLAVLPTEVVLKELIEDGSCLHVIVLMQTSLDTAVLQVEGIEGIMAAYGSALRNVALAGPTLFGQVINTAAEIAGRSLSQDSSKYFVLLIITDGVLTDLQETKDALVMASDLPLSILIVGVGGVDFKQMEKFSPMFGVV
ncbi:unnamed protein product [Camellia sinensis]